MRRIKGFEAAKPLLQRYVSFESPPLSPELKKRIKDVFGRGLTAEQVVERIITHVRDKGDEALFYYTQKLDGAQLVSLEVSPSEIQVAYSQVDTELVSALKLAAERIYAFHLACKQKNEVSFLSAGSGQQVRPLDRVGIYVPGGSAAYPSTVLMTAIPARVAGVRQIIMTTPPRTDGTISASTLVAADIARVDRVFKLGGAQAIAALAFGTESVSKVDKICGPGNIFVVLAKKMVYGAVDIDGLQGPSEIVIVADDTADPALCAADLLAQAEHDPLASAILITTSSELGDRVGRELKLQLEKLGRRSIVTKALQSQGMIVIVNNIDEAIELVNLYAPEHVSLMVRNAGTYISRVRNAGCIFVSDLSSVVLGDYIAGPSHVLPTGGSARFGSPLNISHFLKITNLINLDKTAIRGLGQAAMTIAKAEGLNGHARALEMRLNKMKEKA